MPESRQLSSLSMTLDCRKSFRARCRGKMAPPLQSRAPFPVQRSERHENQNDGSGDGGDGGRGHEAAAQLPPPALGPIHTGVTFCLDDGCFVLGRGGKRAGEREPRPLDPRFQSFRRPQPCPSPHDGHDRVEEVNELLPCRRVPKKPTRNRRISAAIRPATRRWATSSPRRFRRRDLLKGTLGVAAIAATIGPLALATARPSQAEADTRFRFKRARGRRRRRSSRRGRPRRRRPDPVGRSGAARRARIRSDAPERRRAEAPVRLQQRLSRLSAAAGRRRPITPRVARGQPRIHQRRADVPRPRPAGAGYGLRPHEQGRWSTFEMAAHGGSVIEVRRDTGKWRVVPGSKYARRIHADTPMEIAGPAAGHARMRTGADPPAAACWACSTIARAASRHGAHG